MARTYKLFISTVTEDLEEERAAIRSGLPPNYNPYFSGQDGARRGDLKDVLLDEIKTRHIFVGILGGKWGDDCKEPCLVTKDSMSWVEWEFWKAVGPNCKHLEVIILEKKLAPAEIEPEQIKTIKCITGSNEVVPKKFDSPDTLAGKLNVALLTWRDRLHEAEGENDLWTGWLAFGFATLLAVGAIFLLATAIIKEIEFRTMCLVAAIAGAMVLLAFLLVAAYIFWRKHKSEDTDAG